MLNTLDKLSLNKTASIESLQCTGSNYRRLLDLGLIKGTKITPVLVSPSGDPTAYEVRGSVLALRNEDSTKIIISE